MLEMEYVKKRRLEKLRAHLLNHGTEGLTNREKKLLEEAKRWIEGKG